MPRPRTGAALRYIPFNVPGFKGLNKQSEGAMLGPEWATRLENTVIDDDGRLAARKGWLALTTTTAAADDFKQLHEEQSSGTLLGSAENDKIYESTDGGDTWSDVTNTATISDDSGQFHDFNGYVLYIQSGQRPAVYQTGVADFTTVADVNAPTGGVSLAAFGRVWGVTSTGKSFRYSGLLDHTDWTSSDSGLIDMTSVWQGDDQIQALAAFNGHIVIFGQRNIVTMTDGQGSALGIDPLNLYVVDTVSGLGCAARDSVQSVEGDLWFLSQSGLMSFGRLIQERSNPINNLSSSIQDHLIGVVTSATAADIRGIYSPRDQLYILSIPKDNGAGVEAGAAYAFDTRGAAQATTRCVGIWSGMVPTAACVAVSDGALILSIRGQVGEVGQYTGYQDAAAAYTLEYESGWFDVGSPQVKMLKKVSGIFFIGSSYTINFKWAFDFVDAFNIAPVAAVGASGLAEFGEAEFAIGEFNSGVILREISTQASRNGEHVKIGINTAIDGAALAIQQISMYAREGRLR